LSLPRLPAGGRRRLRGGGGGAEIEVRFKGEQRYHKTVGDAGRAVERGFCTTCGCPVAVKLERMPGIVGLHAASLDDPSRYKPGMDIFTNSAQPWDHMDPRTKKVPHGLTG
jgi:hypothetical protein